MFETIVNIKSKIISTSIQNSTPMTKMEKRRKRLEASMEGFGDLFKSSATKQKERVDAALKKLDDLKKEFVKDREWQIEHNKKSLAYFSKEMNQISDEIKGKKIDSNAFSNFILPEFAVYFKVIKNETESHGKVLDLLKKLFRDGSPEETLIDFRKAAQYVWWEELEEGQFIDEDHPVKAMSAGYKEDFVTWAISIVSSETKAAHDLYTESEGFLSFIDKQKSNIKTDSTSDEIHKILKLCNTVQLKVDYALGHVNDEHRYHEIILISKAIVKECYK